MSLAPYVIAWTAAVLAALALRLLAPGGSVGLACLYGLASGLVVACAVARYFHALNRYLREEHPVLWSRLDLAPRTGPRLVRLLRWLVAPDEPPSGDLREARASGGWIAVMAAAWLISTPAICLLLALRVA